MSDQPRRLEAARFAVREGAAVCRAVQRAQGDVRTLTKADRSPVTVADLACQAVVIRALQEYLGGVTVVAEESAAMLRREIADGKTATIDAVVEAARIVWHNATREDILDTIDLGAADPPDDPHLGFWTLDPIDGTKGFIRGEQYAVCLAWIEHGRPVAAALGCPNLPRDLSEPLDVPDTVGSIYIAGEGDGLYELPGDDADAEPLHIRRLPAEEGEPVRLVESVDASHSDHTASREVLRELGEQVEPVRLDSQAKYAVVARGQADLYLRIPKASGYVERIWDHAPGALVAGEVGLVATDIDGRPLDFSRGRGMERNRGILVAPPDLHGRVLGALERLGRSRREG